jgi:phosphoribosylformylglycinamidine synthase
MLTIPGTPALSSFRIEKLLSQLQSQDNSIQAINARFVHFVQLDGQLTDAETQMLNRLLDYGFSCASVESSPSAETWNSTSLWIVPRVGTISPWSSVVACPL